MATVAAGGSASARGERRIELVDGDLVSIEAFLDRTAADGYLRALLDGVPWEQHHVRIRGRRIPSPRLSAWYGDAGADYTYSGLALRPRPWTGPIAELKGRVEVAAGCAFNSVLANLYRNGADSMGWHSDDEPELGARPTIASLSVGATRRFRLRHRQRRDLDPVEVSLEHGSLLVMRGSTQQHWKHQVPKTARVHAPRVNLTFRTVALAGPAPEPLA